MSQKKKYSHLVCSMRAFYFFSGVLGIKVKIMLPWDPTGKNGPRTPLPDHINIVEPKVCLLILCPYLCLIFFGFSTANSFYNLFHSVWPLTEGEFLGDVAPAHFKFVNV